MQASLGLFDILGALVFTVLSIWYVIFAAVNKEAYKKSQYIYWLQPWLAAYILFDWNSFDENYHHLPAVVLLVLAGIIGLYRTYRKSKTNNRTP